MPRPKVDRVARSMRLPAELDAQLAAHAEALGVSVNVECEEAIRAWIGAVPPTERDEP